MVHRASSAAYAALFSELIAGPSTVVDMINACGMHENTIRKFIAAMYRIDALQTVALEKDKQGRMSRKVHALRGWRRNRV